VNDSIDPKSQTEFERTNVVKLNEMRLKRMSPKPDGRNAYEQLKVFVIERLSAFMISNQEELVDKDERTLLLGEFNKLLKAERIILNRSERRKLIEDVLSEVLDPDL
jgi:hypothetical protein